jgi:hypothetical protein
MLADPQSVNSVSLPRTGIGQDSATYTSADGALSLRVQTVRGKDRNRFIISIQSTKIAADPLTAVNQRVSSVASVTVTAPLSGFTTTELKDLTTGLFTALTATSNAMLLKILGGEK